MSTPYAYMNICVHWYLSEYFIYSCINGTLYAKARAYKFLGQSVNFYFLVLKGEEVQRGQRKSLSGGKIKDSLGHLFLSIFFQLNISQKTE